MTTQHSRLRQLPENARIFWEKKQQEVNDTLLLFSYATFVETPHVPASEKNGLLYLMERDLWFEDFQKPQVFFLPQKADYTKTVIQIPRPTIENAELIRESLLADFLQGKRQQINKNPRGIFWWFGSDPVHLVISGTQESESQLQYIFREMEDPESWVQALTSKN